MECYWWSGVSRGFAAMPGWAWNLEAEPTLPRRGHALGCRWRRRLPGRATLWCVRAAPPQTVRWNVWGDSIQSECEGGLMVLSLLPEGLAATEGDTIPTLMYTICELQLTRTNRKCIQVFFHVCTLIDAHWLDVVWDFSFSPSAKRSACTSASHVCSHDNGRFECRIASWFESSVETRWHQFSWINTKLFQNPRLLAEVQDSEKRQGNLSARIRATIWEFVRRPKVI